MVRVLIYKLQVDSPSSLWHKEYFVIYCPTRFRGTSCTDCWGREDDVSWDRCAAAFKTDCPGCRKACLNGPAATQWKETDQVVLCTQYRISKNNKLFLTDHTHVWVLSEPNVLCYICIYVLCLHYLSGHQIYLPFNNECAVISIFINKCVLVLYNSQSKKTVMQWITLWECSLTCNIWAAWSLMKDGDISILKYKK